MSRRLVAACLLLLPSFALVPRAKAESKNPAEYPLRIHIFRRSETNFYHHRVEEEAKGEGRGDLYEGGEAKGVDFQFECSQKLPTSSGFETFPARWKKPGAELVVLTPQFGKPGSYDTCHLKVEMKDFAYYTRQGQLESEPIAAYKQWMVKHEYDPEHGKDTPVRAMSEATQNPSGPAGAVSGARPAGTVQAPALPQPE